MQATSFPQFVRDIARYGTDAAPDSERRLIETCNLLAIGASALTGLFSFYYVANFGSALGAALDLVFAVAYLLNFLLLRTGDYLAARGSVFAVFMVDIFVTSLLFFDADARAHLYLMVAGPIGFFLFERHHRSWRYSIAASSVVLYLLVEISDPVMLLGSPRNALLTDAYRYTTVPAIVLMLLIVERSFLIQIGAREHALAVAARTDPLTGLPNRTAAFDAAAALLSEIGPDGGAEVLMIDIDNFKQINDSHGHLVGDQVLVAAAHMLERCVRSTDVIGRFGGEEFIVVSLADFDQEPRRTAERLRTAVETIVVQTPSGESVTCTVSIGVARWGRSNQRLDELIEASDRALYAAKAAGRNRSIASPDPVAI